MDIACFSTTDWDEIWGSRQQIMLRLADAGHRVLFIERQVSFEHLFRDPVLLNRKLARWREPRLKQLSSNLWLWCPPIMLPGRYYSMMLNSFGQHLLILSLRSALEHLSFTQPILWLYPPHSAPLLKQMGEKCSIYHCIDHFSGNQTGLKRSIIERQEKLLLKKVDIVFTHSEGLRRKYAHLTRHPITIIPSATDVRLFQSTSNIHQEVAKILKPRIGIMGTFDGRLDTDLLKKLILQHPDWNFVFIGQIRPGRTNLKKLFRYSNTHYLGAKKYRELPTLLNGMDLFLIPYKLNELTEYINPLKLYEYLAVGKPIISVPLPEIMHMSNYIDIVSPDAFSSQMKQALENDTPESQYARREAARNHTWDSRLQDMLITINEFLRQTDL